MENGHPMTSLIVHVKWMSAAVIVEHLSVSDGRRLSPALMDAINDVNLFLMTSSSLCFPPVKNTNKASACDAPSATALSMGAGFMNGL